ncbi:long-chain fatty acid--CoA ligase [bacterium]|nr:MAG: long-chain fatty acid--CoA ligase [bacterium]
MFLVEINRDNIPSLRDIIPLESVMEFEGDAMLPSISLDDELLILFTSGTTGNSKGVVLTNRNVGSNIDSFLQVLEIYPGDRIFCMLPFHHIFPITTNILAGITVGATMTLARSLKPNELREDLRDSEPQIMTVVPLILEKMVKRIQKEIEKLPALKRGFVKSLKLAPAGIRKRIFSKVREEMGMGKLRYLVSGGAALPEFVSSFLEFMGFPVLQGYGLSETSPVVSVNPPEAPRNKSVGLPLPGVEVKIVDPDKDGIGEIAVRGDLVMKGYYKNPEETKKVITEDGWFLTGDMGRFDKDGYLYITGRKKSVIVTMGGKNIYPEEIEEKLLESPFILETLVISREGQLVAVIHPNFDEIRNEIPGMNEERIKELLRKEVRKINEHLADYKRIRRIMVVEEELPKTTTQKVKRYIITPESIPFERTIKVEE